MTKRHDSAMVAVIMPTAKRRILFLITTADWGGAQHFVFSLASAAKQAGHTVMIAAGGKGELQESCLQNNLRFEELLTVRRELSPFHDLAALHEIRQLIKHFKPDVVHLNSSKISVIGAIAASLEHIPRVIYRIGGWAFLEDISTFKRAIYLWSEKLTASKKDIIVTLHPGDEAQARQHHIVPRQQLVTIPNGINLARFDTDLLPRNEARARLNLAQHAYVIGTVANFYPPKNLARYLETMKPLLEEKPDMRVVIIGDGPERQHIEATRTRLGLEASVILAGRRQDASALLSAFDLFVLPSSKEGMPWSLLEAMAARLPCIATDVGACRWMLEPDAGRIVPANDPSAMQSTIKDLIMHDQERKRLGIAARLAVETRFRWETTLEKSLALFD